jgi:hypothetical protein
MSPWLFALSAAIAGVAMFVSLWAATMTWRGRQAMLVLERTAVGTWVLQNLGLEPAYNIELRTSNALAVSPETTGCPGAIARGERALHYDRLDPRAQIEYVIHQRTTVPHEVVRWVEISWTRRERGRRRQRMRTVLPHHALDFEDRRVDPATYAD